MTQVNMKAGKITAKLRDAVLVHFFECGEDRAQYKNIDIPDSLKELEVNGFEFDVPMDGKVTFRLYFDNGVLPAEFPPAREKMSLAEKAAAKATQPEAVDTVDLAEAAADAITAATGSEVNVEPADAPEAPAIPEYRFNVTGARRKELAEMLAAAISDEKPKYLGAPSFAFAIGANILDKKGTLTGEISADLLAALAEQGFIPEVE